MSEEDFRFIQENLSMANIFKSVSSTAAMAHCRKANERLLRVINRSKTGLDYGNQYVSFGKIFSELKKSIPKENQRFFEKVQFGFANPELHDLSMKKMSLEDIEEAIYLVRKNSSSLLGIKIDESQLANPDNTEKIIQKIVNRDLALIGILSAEFHSDLTFEQECIVDDVLHIVDAAEEIGVNFDHYEYLDIGRAAEIRGNLFSAERYYREVLKHCKTVGDKVGEIDSLTHLSSIAYKKGDLDYLSRLDKKILALSEDADYTTGKVVAYQGIGLRCHQIGQLDEAEENYRVSQNLLDSMDDEIGKAGLMLNLSRVQVDFGNLILGEEMVRNALDIFKKEKDMTWESKAYSHLSGIKVLLGQYSEALEINLENLKRKKKLDDAIGEAGMMLEIGSNYISLNELDKANDYTIEALNLSRKIGHRKLESAALGNLGDIVMKGDNYLRSEKYILDSLEIAREIEHAEYIAISLMTLGILKRRMKDFNKSMSYFEESLDISTNSGFKILQDQCNHNMGLVLRDTGDLKKAIEKFRKSIDSKNSSGISHSVAKSQRSLAECYYELGQFEDAIRLIKQSILSIQTLGGHQSSVCSQLRTLARFYADKGEYELSKKTLLESLQISVSIDDKKSEALCFHELGFLEWKFGNNENEERYYLQCLEINRKEGFLLGEADVLRDMSRNARRDNLLEKSAQMLERCNEIRTKIGLNHLDS